MQELLLRWLRARARQCTDLGFGNDAALFEKAAATLKGVQPQFFIMHPKLASVIEAMDKPLADATAAPDVAAAVEELKAEQAAVEEKHEELAKAAAQAVPSGPKSEAPPAPAPDSPAVAPPDAPALSPEEVAAKFAPGT